MAATSSSSFTQLHQPLRSISLPSRIHPTCLKFEAALTHLKQICPSCPRRSVVSGADKLEIRLIGLAELYNIVQEIFHSPHKKLALLRYQNGKLVEDALNGSAILLDTCDTARNIVLTTKEHVQRLQSALRRRARQDYSSDVNAYISFRKKAKREIVKTLGALKKMESKGYLCPLVDADDDQMIVIKILREATAITVSIFRSLLVFLQYSTKTKPLMISKLIPLRPSSSEIIINEVERVDFALCKNATWTQVETIHDMLHTLSSRVHGLEAGLDFVFKSLVQNRVSFLNILTSF
ncbi:uncharacterized protein LOC110822519 [Carica papaya]|uniref:uncharacterized protein LOC110822519 n=1 Tax=Carica papaya TaxID=3649 RepID=UPI000B8C7F48|nr:uncharacterized protein LOC110822519 [Carica papaya]